MARGRKKDPHTPKKSPGRKRKQGAKPKTAVETSKLTTQDTRLVYVGGYWKRTPKAHRKKAHKRKKRSTRKEIQKRGGTRKQVRRKKKEKKFKKIRQRRSKTIKPKKKNRYNKPQKTRQTRFGTPKTTPAARSLIKRKTKD